MGTGDRSGRVPVRERYRSVERAGVLIGIGAGRQPAQPSDRRAGVDHPGLWRCARGLSVSGRGLQDMDDPLGGERGLQLKQERHDAGDMGGGE